jgi:hypothetical protein
MFSVFDGFGPKKGWFHSSSSFNSRPFPSGTSGTPAACFSLFLLSYVQPCNRPESVIDHEDDYKDKED